MKVKIVINVIVMENVSNTMAPLVSFHALNCFYPITDDEKHWNQNHFTSKIECKTQC